MASQIRVRMVVTGLVQGVFFRASTLEQAQSLGLLGSVRNREDGAVEIVAQGDAEAVEALGCWAHQGPPEAEVRTVHLNPEPLDPELLTFQIVR